jgi:hypothetical protein
MNDALHIFPQSFQVYVEIIPYNKPRLSPSTSIPFIVTFSFHGIYKMQFRKSRLTKTKIKI